ncbi:hypothetical protein VNI00_015777 [Paramarasmius palmivorus]|uniref:Uncharacterized protein n=1 Tax=Paramarasmius palmivorus TaxID=297713 RepID=A0AAW0BK06_9AGAR
MSTIGSCLAANPDVSGIGVRLAVYAQTFLSFAPAFLFTADGELDVEEEKVLFAIYAPLLLSSMALLVTTVFQQVTSGLGNHYMLLVLKMMWMMNVSAVVVCVAPTLAWFRRPVPMLPKSSSTATGQSTALKYVRERYLLFWWPRRKSQLLEVLLVSLCITGMSVLGLWHWSILHIGGINEDLNPSQCFDQIRTTVLFTTIPITNELNRRLSLVFYAIMVPPIINVALMVIFINVFEWGLVTPARKLWHGFRDRFLGGDRSQSLPFSSPILHALSGHGHDMRRTEHSDVLESIPPITQCSTAISNFQLDHTPKSNLRLDTDVEAAPNQASPTPSTKGKHLYDFLFETYTICRTWLDFFPLKHFLAISFPFLIAFQTAVDIEMSIDLNLHLMGNLEEDQWTFGQILALLLVVAPALRVGQILLEQTFLGSHIRKWASKTQGCHSALDLSWFMRGLLTRSEWRSLHETIFNNICLAQFACTQLGDATNVVAFQGIFALEWHLLLAISQFKAVDQVFTFYTKPLPSIPSESEPPKQTSSDEEAPKFLADNPLKILKISLIGARDSVSIAQSVRFSDVTERERYREGAVVLACLMDTLYSALKAVERLEVKDVLQRQSNHGAGPQERTGQLNSDVSFCGVPESL